MSYVFCAKEAAIPIKSYSPEIMVIPFYDDEFVEKDGEETGSIPEEKCTTTDYVGEEYIMKALKKIKTTLSR